MNNKAQSFQEFLATQSIPIPVPVFVIDLLLAGVCAYLLGKLYTRYGRALSNRSLFSSNFVLIAMTTMVIISIVKSSLALSLGLVGALSIVRFRAAIKEPEELAFLFLTIALGLGFGAGQRAITLIGFIVIGGIVATRQLVRNKTSHTNLVLTISGPLGDKLTSQSLVETLKEHASLVDLKRYDENESQLEASFLVEYKDFAQFEDSKSAIKSLSPTAQISFLDHKGLL